MGALKREKNKSGTLKPRWIWRFRDHNGRTRKIALFTQKKLSAEAGRRIDLIVEHRAAGRELPPDLLEWLRHAPTIGAKLDALEVVPAPQRTQRKTLEHHIDDWEDEMRRFRTAGYALAQANRVRVLFERCGFIDCSDISEAVVEATIAEMRRDVNERGERLRADATINHHLRAAKTFCKWMASEKQKRAASNPLATARGISKPVLVRERRALTPHEARRLIQAAKHGPPARRIDGPTRALIYRLALATGLRASAIGSLTTDSFNFDTIPPTVTLEPQHSKNGRRITNPLKPLLANDLKAHLAMKAPGAKAFDFGPHRSSDCVNFDLRRAGLRKRDGSGRQLDFHALRHTFGTQLAEADVNPRQAQELLGHAHVTTTLSFYTHVSDGGKAAAIDRLPDLDVDKEGPLRMAGA